MTEALLEQTAMLTAEPTADLTAEPTVDLTAEPTAEIADERMTPSQMARRMAIEGVEREAAEFAAAQAAIAARLDAREVAERQRREQTKARQRARGPSVVYTVRLGHDEVEALEQRAAMLEMPPRALARNLIRTGLRPARSSDDLVALADELHAVANRLRQVR